MEANQLWSDKLQPGWQVTENIPFQLLLQTGLTLVDEDTGLRT